MDLLRNLKIPLWSTFRHRETTGELGYIGVAEYLLCEVNKANVI